MHYDAERKKKLTDNRRWKKTHQPFGRILCKTQKSCYFDQNESAATVVTERRNLLIQPFKPTDRLSVGKAGGEWLEEIEREFRYYRIKAPNDKKDALLLFGGRELRRLYKYLPDLAPNHDEYQKIRKKN